MNRSTTSCVVLVGWLLTPIAAGAVDLRNYGLSKIALPSRNEVEVYLRAHVGRLRNATEVPDYSFQVGPVNASPLGGFLTRHRLFGFIREFRGSPG